MHKKLARAIKVGVTFLCTAAVYTGCRELCSCCPMQSLNVIYLSLLKSEVVPIPTWCFFEVKNILFLFNILKPFSGVKDDGEHVFRN